MKVVRLPFTPMVGYIPHKIVPAIWVKSTVFFLNGKPAILKFAFKKVPSPTTSTASPEETTEATEMFNTQVTMSLHKKLSPTPQKIPQLKQQQETRKNCPKKKVTYLVKIHLEKHRSLLPSHTFVSFQWWSETGYQDRSFLPTIFFPEQFEPHHWGVYQPMVFSIPFVFFGFTKTIVWIFWGAFSAPKICTVLEGCLAKLIRDLGWYGRCFQQRRKLEKGADEVYSCWMFSSQKVFLVVDEFFE